MKYNIEMGRFDIVGDTAYNISVCVYISYRFRYWNLVDTFIVVWILWQHNTLVVTRSQDS